MIFFRWFCDLFCLFWCPHDIKWIKFSPTCPKFGRLDSKVTDSGFENGIQPADNLDFHSDRELLFHLLRMLRNLIYKVDKKKSAWQCYLTKYTPKINQGIWNNIYMCNTHCVCFLNRYNLLELDNPTIHFMLV